MVRIFLPVRGSVQECLDHQAEDERVRPGGDAVRVALEGVRRQAWSYGGTRYDKQVWAVLAPEWASSRP